MVLRTRSIANVVSTLFNSILSTQIPNEKEQRLRRNGISTSRARKLRNVRDEFSAYCSLDFPHDL